MINLKTSMLNLFFVVCIVKGYCTSYGLWVSPITAEKMAEGAINKLSMHIDGKDSYWCEMRPKNKGRYTIVRLNSAGNTEDMTPPDFNVRTFVHEYGGGSFTVFNGTIYASNGNDGAIYVIKDKLLPVRLTKEGSTTRFADMHVTTHGLVAIAETHEPNQPVENFLALVDLSNGNVSKLHSGYDFYSSPAISSDGKKIAWIAWNHPNMPWTNTGLWLADFDSSGLKNLNKITGEHESIFEPQFSSEGVLYFVSDRNSGWWNLHRYQNDQVENIAPMDAEVAKPLWNLDQSTYAFLGENIVFTYNKQGAWHLAKLDTKTLHWKEIPTSGSTLHQMRGSSDFVRFLEQYPTKGESLVQMDANEHFEILHSIPVLIDEGFVSIPKHISYLSNGRIAYGKYYAPKNKNYQNPKDEKPPLIVMIHGGPTSQSSNSFSIGHQFWTSRGFALLDVDYGGSTGYGRDYRNLLNGQWGIVDVEDCVNGALFLVSSGLVDENKLAIRGGSAGGYTTLAALAFKDTFNAGASYFGVADITALQLDTHKFESRYMDGLIGKYPEDKHLWEERSPINSVEKIHVPLIIFQGEDDKVVPKNQSIMIYEALKKRGVCVELYIYPGEEHGFRQEKNIIDSVMKEKNFYLQVFGLINDGIKCPRDNL